jgi:hypothetical protein
MRAPHRARLPVDHHRSRGGRGPRGQRTPPSHPPATRPCSSPGSPPRSSSSDCQRPRWPRCISTTRAPSPASRRWWCWPCPCSCSDRCSCGHRGSTGRNTSSPTCRASVPLPPRSPVWPSGSGGRRASGRCSRRSSPSPPPRATPAAGPCSSACTRHFTGITIASVSSLAVFGVILALDRLVWVTTQLQLALDSVGLDILVELG